MLRTVSVFTFAIACTYQAYAQVEVSSSAELIAALNAASGGKTIRLTDGDYGSLDLHDYSFTSYVTITSKNARTGVQFDNIDVDNSSYLRLDDLTMIPGAREGVGIFGESHHIQVRNSDIYGANRFSRSAPDYTQVSTLYGINVGEDSHDILIENNSVQDVTSSAYVFAGVNDLTVVENRCDWVASDCFKFASVNNLLFENNFGAQHIYSAPGAHVDFVQGQGSVSNAVFRGNVAIMGSRTFQGLFFDDATFSNILFENNLIYSANNRGISVSQGSNIEARYNTVLRVAGSQKATFISLPSGSVKNHNIEANNTTKNANRFPGTNIVAQWDDGNDIAHYSDYYVNAMHGPFATIQDFRPVGGSPAVNQVGAFSRIYALLNGSSGGGNQGGGQGTNNGQFNPAPVNMLLLSE